LSLKTEKGIYNASKIESYIKRKRERGMIKLLSNVENSLI